MTDDGCWAEVRRARFRLPGPALLLDRDGVLIEDTGYPSCADAIVMVPETLDLVRVASLSGYAIAVVTNQSGIGRGLFDWTAFQAVQRAIEAAVTAAGGRIDAVFACPYHEEAVVPALRGPHPWRKPAPGMVLAAIEALNLDARRSVLIGDQMSDLAAAAASGIGHPFMLVANTAREAGDDRVRRADLLAVVTARLALRTARPKPSSVASSR